MSWCFENVSIIENVTTMLKTQRFTQCLALKESIMEHFNISAQGGKESKVGWLVSYLVLPVGLKVEIDQGTNRILFPQRLQEVLLLVLAE